MVWIIRIICFIITTLIYVPIESALAAANTSRPLVWLITGVIYFFIFYIPSNALIAMWKKRKDERAYKLCDELWLCTLSFISKTGISNKGLSVVCIWTAYYYAVLEIVNHHHLHEQMQQLFVSSFAKRFNVNNTDDFSRSLLSAQNEMLSRMPSNPTTPLSPFDISKILQLALYLGDLENDWELDEYSPDSDLYIEFTARIAHISNFAINLFPAK